MFHSVPVAFSVPFFMFVAGRRRRMERDSLSLFAMLLISFVVWIYRVIEREREIGGFTESDNGNSGNVREIHSGSTCLMKAGFL